MVLERNVRCIERNDLALHSSGGLERSDRLKVILGAFSLE